MPFDNPHQAPIGDLEYLLNARARISRQNTWVQRCYKYEDRHCLVAALSLASGSRGFNYPNRTERRLAEALVVQLPAQAPFGARIRLIPARHRLMAFNDHPRTRQEDILALIDRTICHLESSLAAKVAASG